MTETTAPAASHAADPMAALAGPLRAAFTAAMVPYVTGDAVASADLSGILTEAVLAADPSPELIGALCDLITGATPTTTLLALMHEAVGVALGLTPAAPTARTARPPQTRQAAPAVTRSGGLRERIAELFTHDPAMQWTVTELAHRLGNSSGAVGAALERMLGNGEAILAATTPKRYAAPGQVEQAASEQAASEEAAPEDGVDSQPRDRDAEGAPETTTDEAPDTSKADSPEAEAPTGADTPAPAHAARRKGAKSADA
ncbi:hypothetical protein [Actinospica robiniae]|uniref:hypothetical protein n=1 Tax=Actinospica robiniae TaxID=304901 RepID=UPI0003F6BEDF|nr:hypothetical protein [Actinospica robiniae]